ncbi:MAG: hypothetical protein WC358_10565 [Ignavibacteria bacterium]
MYISVNSTRIAIVNLQRIQIAVNLNVNNLLVRSDILSVDNDSSVIDNDVISRKGITIDLDFSHEKPQFLYED